MIHRSSPQGRLTVPAGVISTLVISLLFGCGKVGPPVPPVRFGERTTGLTAVQRGSSVVLTWPAPSLAAGESSRGYIARVAVYRLVERRDTEPALDADDYEDLAQLVGVLDRAALETQASATATLQFIDVIDLGSRDDLANIRLRYAVRYVNRRGHEAMFSNTVAIEPAPGVAVAPVNLRPMPQEQDAITLEWEAPGSNVDGGRPASVVGYNVYRRIAGRPAAREPLNSEPLSEPKFVDRRFRYQASYIYTVRALSPGLSGFIESADSEQVQVTPEDTFAPAAPEPVSIASANGVISLFWPASTERDVVGYNVYRLDAREDETPAESGSGKEWNKLTAAPITTTTFHDDSVVIGKRYLYKVTAVDRFDNESMPSREVVEKANP